MTMRRGLMDALLSEDPQIRSIGERFRWLMKENTIDVEKALTQGAQGALRAQGMLRTLGDVKGLVVQDEATKDLAAASLGTAMYMLVGTLGIPVSKARELFEVFLEDYMGGEHEEALAHDADPIGAAHQEAIEEDAESKIRTFVDLLAALKSSRSPAGH